LIVEVGESQSKRIFGLVLCGGQSRRMGSDKGLREHKGKIWAQIVSSVMQQAGLDVYISIREEQTAAYQKYFSPDKLITDNTQLAIDGPMTGLVSAHEKFPENDWLTLACDMIDMDRLILMSLITAYASEPGFYFYITGNPQDKGRYEPLCAIYTSRGLSRISAKKIDLHDFSLARSALFDNCYILHITRNAGRFLKNYNTEKEYQNHKTEIDPDVDAKNDPDQAAT